VIDRLIRYFFILSKRKLKSPNSEKGDQVKLLLITILGLGVLVVVPCLATINVVVSTYDGIVVAADSRVTLTSAENTRILSEYGEKVKQIGSHVAVVFSGTAYLYDTEADLRNIGSIVDQYKATNLIGDSDHIDPKSVAEGLDSLFMDVYNRHQEQNLRGELQVMICGYDTSGERRIYELFYPKKRESSTEDRDFDIYGVLDSTFTSGIPGALVRGQSDTWVRLIKGYDPKLGHHDWFREVQKGVPDSLDSTVTDTILTREKLNLNDFRYDIHYELMTLQDAIDYAVFIVRATIEAQRFNQGSIQGVGGAIDIAVVTADGFRWIQRKRLHGEGAPELIEQ